MALRCAERALSHEVPVVDFTALKGLLPNKQAFAAGAGVYMTKPFPGGRFLDAAEIAPQNATLKHSPPIKKGGGGE
jgi:CheY-like chemotaxis protein